jgi:hypothetical protein
MTLISGGEYVTLHRFDQKVGKLEHPWQGTIVSLVIELVNPLPLERVYEEEVERLVPHTPNRGGASTPADIRVSIGPRGMESPPSVGEGLAAATHRLVLRTIGTSLLSRETGLVARAELATLLSDGNGVEVDLDGVEDMTPSVADECFGKLAARLGEARYRARVSLRGGPPLLHRLIDFVVANRLKQQGTEATSTGSE